MHRPSDTIQVPQQLIIWKFWRDIGPKLHQFKGGRLQPKIFGKLELELVVGLSGPTYGQTFSGVFEVPDPPAPAWCHAQIWPPKMAISENGPKSGLRVLYGPVPAKFLVRSAPIPLPNYSIKQVLTAPSSHTRATSKPQPSQFHWILILYILRVGRTL